MASLCGVYNGSGNTQPGLSLPAVRVALLSAAAGPFGLRCCLQLLGPPQQERELRCTLCDRVMLVVNGEGGGCSAPPVACMIKVAVPHSHSQILSKDIS